MLRYLTERLPAMITPRWVDTRIEPIAIRDVLRYLVGAAGLPAEVSRWWAVAPFHGLVFGGMARNIAATAEHRERTHAHAAP